MKSKLRCFNCGYRFKDKKEIFRNKANYPLCKECVSEELSDDWNDESMDNILEDIRKNFKGRVKKFEKDFFEKMEICSGCSEEQYDNIYHPKEELVEINGKKYCEMCREIMKENKTKIREKPPVA